MLFINKKYIFKKYNFFSFEKFIKNLYNSEKIINIIMKFNVVNA